MESCVAATTYILSPVLQNIPTLCPPGSQLTNIRTAGVQNRIFKALETGSVVLKRVQQETSIEDLERLMQDTADAKAYQDELQQILASSTVDESIEEAAVAELEELEKARVVEEAAEFPAIPAHKVAVQTKAKEERKAYVEEEDEEEAQMVPA
jgi:charged multivesicular body protein 6